MKTTHIVTAFALSGVLALASGCGKSDDGTSMGGTSDKSTMQQMSNAAVKAADTVQSTAAAAKETVTKDANAVAKATTDAAAKANDAVQGIIDQAKTLVGQKSYQPALDTLGKLTSYKLTDDQQKVVDDLKAQIQKLMTADAGKAVNSLLGK